MRPPPHGSGHRHPTETELAYLLDSNAAPEAWIVEHLAACRHCLAVYTEFVEVRSAMVSTPGIPEPSSRWIRRGLAVAQASPRLGTVVDKPRRRPAWQLPLAGMAAAALVVVATFAIERFGLERKRDRIAVQARADSEGGLLYADNLPPSLRGVRGSSNDAGVDAILAEMTVRYHDGTRSPDDAFWLVAGFLSRNDLGNADAYLRDVLILFPGDERLHNLSAILAFKRNDLEAAASHLKAAISIRESSAHLYNLAVVRLEAGDSSASALLVERVRSGFPGSPGAELAGRLLTK